MVLNRYTVQMVKEQTAHYSVPELSSPEEIYQMLCEALHMDTKLQEEVHVVMFNAKMKPIGSALIGKGTATSCHASMADVFRPAILKGACGIILTHNHPSGEVEPSIQDDTLTKRAIDAGKILGIEVMDHIICGDGCFYSYHNAREDMFK